MISRSPSKQSPSKSVDKSANENKVVIKKEPGVDYDDEGTGKETYIIVNSELDSKNKNYLLKINKHVKISVT